MKILYCNIFWLFAVFLDVEQIDNGGIQIGVVFLELEGKVESNYLS